MMPRLLTMTVVLSVVVDHSATAFGLFAAEKTSSRMKRPSLLSSSVCDSHERNALNISSSTSSQRRRILQSMATITATPWMPYAWAIDDVTTVTDDIVVPMKLFIDTANPSLFTINVPQRFFAIRRSSKGDLPDVKTGQGRRGGTIFTAGDMSKAIVVAVERFPVRNLLEEEGYAPTGDLSTFSSIGDQIAIATLLLRRREKDKPGTQNTAVLNKDSVSLSSDGKTLSFSLRQEISVQKPELLMEEMGVSELFRTTLGKATLASNDGQLMAVFASALDQDFNGPDGNALRKTIDSFSATDQSTK
jgi:hypothetical protein